MSDLIRNINTGRTHRPDPGLDVRNAVGELTAIGLACSGQLPVNDAEHPRGRAQLSCVSCVSAATRSEAT